MGSSIRNLSPNSWNPAGGTRTDRRYSRRDLRPPHPKSDRAFRQGHLAIDFPTVSFPSVGALLLGATQLFFATIPFLAAVTLSVYLPAKFVLQLALEALGVPSDGVVSILSMDFGDLLISSLVIPAVVFGLIGRMRTGGTLPPLAQAFRWGRRQWGKTLWNKFKVEITVALWSLFLIVPGLVAMVKLIFTDIIVAIEADGESEVLQRSRDLSEGHRWRIFAALLPALPISLLQTWATLRALQYSRLAMVPVDGLFAVLEQWQTVVILLIYLGLPALKAPMEPAFGKRKAA